MKNIEFLKISKLILIIIFLSSCNKNNLNNISYITNKKTILSAISCEMYDFEGIMYTIEKDCHFNKNGYITKFGRSKGEGLLYYYRNAKENQLKLDENKLSFRIKIDKIRNIIIENKDTIKDFLIKDNKIITPKNKNGRIFIYEFKNKITLPNNV